ncbi:uncharacterized protein LOC135368556 isoform X2 [Ornithodoros turicata]|uniref:uncharacterized protein LOC135368556 isoform X2 n=1 Tax=Ornithodoros turicata TaxID=34597 RepID=UPI00313A1CBB
MSPEKDTDTKQPESSAKDSETTSPKGGKEKGDAPEAGEDQKASPEKCEHPAEVKPEGGGGDRSEGAEVKVKEEKFTKQNGRSNARGPPRGKPKRRRFRRERESQSEAEGTEDSSHVVAKPQRQRPPRENSETQARPDMDEDIPAAHRYNWDDVQKCSLFIGNLTLNVTKQDIQELSEAIVSVRFITRRSAIVNFASEQVANEQLETLKGKEMQGEEIFVEHLRPRERQVTKSDRDLYVRGTPEDIRMDTLGSLFPDAQLIERQTSKVRLRFKDHDTALAAIQGAIGEENCNFKFSFATARPRWIRRGPQRTGFRRRFPRQETRQD